MTLPKIEEALARFIVDLEFDNVPADALEGARQLMQDQLAVQIGCASLPWSQTILELTRTQHVPGKSRVTVAGDLMSAADAAFVNATFGHGFEYDDAHRASSSHPGCCVIPAALAVGEEIGADMKEVLLGIVAGYEAYTRIGILAAPELLERGYHPHAILSNFGAAAVVAKMYRFSFEKTLHAMSIAMSHCSGTTEYTSTGGSVKRVHAGIGTRNGIRAAQMANAGITGPSGFLTGRKGLYRTFLQKEVSEDKAAIFALDAPFEIARLWLKPYCCCGINHAYIDGARQFSGRAGEIDTVELGIQTGGNIVVGNRNENAYAPKIIEHLQYSLPFQFALSLLGKGNGFETHQDYMEGRLDLSEGSEIAQLARKVQITPRTDLDRDYAGKWIADINLTFKDGSNQHLFIEHPLGTADNPILKPDLDDKFRDLTAKSMGNNRSGALLDAINGGDLAMPASQFTALLTV